VMVLRYVSTEKDGNIVLNVVVQHIVNTEKENLGVKIVTGLDCADITNLSMFVKYVVLINYVSMVILVRHANLVEASYIVFMVRQNIVV